MQSKLNHVKKEIKGFKRKKGKCMTIILHNSHATSCPNSKISPPYSTIRPQSRVPDFRMCLFLPDPDLNFFPGKWIRSLSEVGLTWSNFSTYRNHML